MGSERELSLSDRTGAALDRVDLAIVVSVVSVRLVEGLLRLAALPDPPQWIWHVYYAATYALSASFIYRRRASLDRFHITKLSVLLLILSPLAAPLLQVAFNEPLLLAPFRWSWEMIIDLPTILVAVILAVALYLKRLSIRTNQDNGGSLILAIAAGVVASYILESIYALGKPYNPLATRTDLTVGMSVSMLAAQLAFAAAMEEPVFRGILWGCLRQRGWPWPSILVFQAFLFWIAHIYQAIQYPMSFLVGIPFLGIAFGYVAWRTRSIATSMLMHSAANATGWFYGLVTL